MRIFNLLVSVAVSCAAAEPMVERTQVVMGTFASITVPQSQSAHMQKAFERLKAVEKALSSYDKKAVIYRLNSERNVSLAADTYEALELSKRYYRYSGGYFDITVGSVTKDLYRFGEDERIAANEELDNAVVGFQGLHYNEQRAWLDEGIKVDLGGMGKGFGVDKAFELLKEESVRSGIVALSGDIRCIHRCSLQIEDPFGEGPLATFTMRSPDSAVSTSGNYRRFVGSAEHNHLIDPKRKRPQKRFASITLVSTLPNSDLDAYATAASVMPKEEALRFLNTLEAGYIVVENDGSVLIGEGLERYVSAFTLHKTGEADEAEQPQQP